MSYQTSSTNLSDGNFDAFNRLRVSDPHTQFQAKFLYGNEDKLYKTTTASGGTATFVPNHAAWELNTTATSGSKVLRETYHYMEYQPGKSQICLMTGVFGPSVANCVKRIGYYDNNDGLYFVQDGTLGFAVAERSSTSGSPVDILTYQSSWNQDKMDGTGPSGIVLDVTKTQIFMIDFQWLGVGMVRYGLEINGMLYFVHYSEHANTTLTVPYMKSACLPMRYEIVNTAATSASLLVQICSSVVSEGGIDPIGQLFTANNTQAVSIGTGSWTPIISIKVSTTLNSQLFRGKIQITGVESANIGGNTCMFAIVEDATLTSPSWIPVNAVSAVQYDTQSTGYSSGVQRISNLTTKTTADVFNMNDLALYGGSTLTLVAKSVSGGTTTMGAINWRELL
jgi:hypothetical protein